MPICFTSNPNDWTHPAPTQDVICLAKWLKTNKATYDLDDTRLILTGYSAGGHTAPEAALVMATNDQTTNAWSYLGSGSARKARSGATAAR